jgi:hypothetical protein
LAEKFDAQDAHGTGRFEELLTDFAPEPRRWRASRDSGGDWNSFRFGKLWSLCVACHGQTKRFNDRRGYRGRSPRRLVERSQPSRVSKTPPNTAPVVG